MQLGELAKRLKLELDGDESVEITGLARLEDAGPSELTFVIGERYRNAFEASRAGSYLVPPGFDTGGRPSLRCASPYAEFARAIDLLYPRSVPAAGIHPSAAIESSAELGADLYIGAYVVIGEHARIGDRTRLYPHVTVYPHVEIGADCEIHSGVQLREGVRLGDRVVVQSGAVIGSEGFGFTQGADGRRLRIPHRTAVVLGDDCEIGANTTIDAAHPGHPRRGHDTARTRLGRGVAVDNLVQIGHGCDVGDDSTLCAQVGIAGSTDIGKAVTMGGASSAGGHLRVGDHSLVGGRAAVAQGIGPGSQVLGYPAMERRLFGKVTAALKRLPRLLQRVRRIEQQLGIEEKE